MRVINESSLKDIKFLDEGSLANLYTVFFEDELYCYKKFKKFFDEYIMQNIKGLSKEQFPSEYLIPLFLTQEYKNCFSGYLSKCDPKAIKLELISDKNELINFLRKARILIGNLHSECKVIHGDLSATNILINKEKDKCYLIDFDTALRVGQEVKNTNYFTLIIRNYLKYHKFDKNVDVFKFNLMTLQMLTNTQEGGLFPLILSGNLELIENNKDVKRLAKELFYDSRNPLSGEYIIDYI